MEDKCRAEFEKWYSTHAFDYAKDPIGSRDCALQWQAWRASAAQPVPDVESIRFQIEAVTKRFMNAVSYKKAAQEILMAILPYLRQSAPADDGLIEKARQLAAECIANLQPEGRRTKVDEWEACYAGLFTQMMELIALILNRQPGKVSLQKCAEAAVRFNDDHTHYARIMDKWRAIAKAVLTAAGVEYE